MKAIFKANENSILLISDQTHFHLNSTANQQNCRYWALENPRELHAEPLHNPKVTVWCAVDEAAIIDTYFLKTVIEIL